MKTIKTWKERMTGMLLGGRSGERYVQQRMMEEISDLRAYVMELETALEGAERKLAAYQSNHSAAK